MLHWSQSKAKDMNGGGKRSADIDLRNADSVEHPPYTRRSNRGF